VYAIALQSGAFAISDTTSTYTQDNLPRTTGAVRFDQISRPTSLSQPTSLSPYLLVIGVHNLTQSAYPLLVEHVGIIVREKSPVPYPLKVWTPSPGLGYATNPYQVTYQDEAINAVLNATYLPPAGGHVQLAAGEADQLDLHVAADGITSLGFQVQVTYRAANESQPNTLTLPDIYHVAFSDAGNWHPYDLQDGRLVPSGTP
jgi:hypothetical protein